VRQSRPCPIACPRVAGFSLGRIRHLILVLQFPLSGLRWRNVVHALAVCDRRVTRTVMIAITAIAVFFG